MSAGPDSGDGRWWSAFRLVDRTDAAADLLQYADSWRTPDGAEKMPPLSMQQAQMAVDTVLAFVNDAANRRGTEVGWINDEESR